MLSGTVRAGEQAMAPAELAYWIEAMARLAEGLVAAFDRTHGSASVGADAGRSVCHARSSAHGAACLGARRLCAVLRAPADCYRARCHAMLTGSRRRPALIRDGLM